MIIKVNNLKNPVLDSEPMFSWEYPDGEFEGQKKYTLTISDGMKELFKTSEDTDERVNKKVNYSFMPCKKYYVNICSETDGGKTYEGETFFRTGKRGEKWNAKWITGNISRNPDEVLAAVYLRKDFTVPDEVSEAMLYVSGLGYFEAHINGKKVGDDFLSTPYTSYDKRILYRSYDVTGMIEKSNAIGVILGNGFYNCFTHDPWQTSTAPWRDIPKLLCELHITYTDGREDIISSDKSWQSLIGPITFNGIRHGEEYDAGLEKTGWDMYGFSGETFPCKPAKNPGALMFETEMEPIRVRFKYHPKSVRRVANGWLYEIEQNQAGIADIVFKGKRGTVIKIRYCDRLTPDGELDQESLSGFIKNYNFQTDIYTKGTDEPEKWHPIFTYHGFQYIEISGCEEAIDIADIEVWSLCNDFEIRGEFSTNDALINKIQHMCLYSTTSCCMNTFVSDTVREKSSWTGDTGFSTEQLLINFGAEQFMKKWQQDLRDSQRPGGCLPCIVPSPGWGYNRMNGPDWSSPMVTVPWNIYTSGGDTDVLKDNYKALCSHCDYIESMSYDGIADYGLGDWCAPFEGAAVSVNMESFKCPVAVTDTAYYYNALKTAEKYAHIFGYSEDEKLFKEKSEFVRNAFRGHFFDKEHGIIKGDCQTSTAVAIYFGLADNDEIPLLIKNLLIQIDRENGHLDFGVLGANPVLSVLGECGYADIALKMLTNPTYPSCKKWIDMGANTLWECWNGGGSRNHHMFSVISAFLYKYIGGISAGAPGYRKIVFRPYVKGTLDVSADIKTPYGKSECTVTHISGKTKINITVPSSCAGRIIIGNTEKTVSSGKYEFIV